MSRSTSQLSQRRMSYSPAGQRGCQSEPARTPFLRALPKPTALPCSCGPREMAGPQGEWPPCIPGRSWATGPYQVNSLRVSVLKGQNTGLSSGLAQEMQQGGLGSGQQWAVSREAPETWDIDQSLREKMGCLLKWGAGRSWQDPEKEGQQDNRL